ncbi:MAG: transposase, partial [Dehalococcoidia bacterium]|nr:transposase [Dehalococcoidia bacterium]
IRDTQRCLVGSEMCIRDSRRDDLMQVMIGLVMTREGIPIAHQVFPGNTADITTFGQAIADLKQRFAVRRVVIVADRGVVAESLLGALDREGIGYIVGIPLRKWQASRRVLQRAGRYRQVADNLRVKEVWEGEQRYIVCHNPEREGEDSRRRAEIVAALEARLREGGLAGLAKRKGYGRYIEVSHGGEARVNWEKVKKDERYDGRFVLRSNTELSAGEIALAYKELWRVEQGFRELKSGLEVRPIRHWTPSRVRGHIMVCFLALVMESMLLKLMRDQAAKSSYQAVMKDLEQVKAVKVNLKDKSYLLRTELKGRAYDAFQAVGIRPPPRIQPFPG